MGKGIDKRKISLMIGFLYKNPDGAWIRQISKEVGISPTTVSKYASVILKPLIEETSLGNEEKPLMRVIKLKPFVIQKLDEGKSIGEILKLIEIYRNIE